MHKLLTDDEYAAKEYEKHIKQLGYNMMKNKRVHEVSIETNHPEILKYINFKKQKDIENLLNNLDKNSDDFHNCKIIVFGSATNGLCSWYSDIDFCLDISIADEEDFSVTRRKLFSIIRNSIESEYDILTLQNLSSSEKIVKIIEEEGVIIWPA